MAEAAGVRASAELDPRHPLLQGGVDQGQGPGLRGIRGWETWSPSATHLRVSALVSTAVTSAAAAVSEDQPSLHIEGVVVRCPARLTIEAAVRDVLQGELGVEPLPQGRPAVLVEGQPVELEGHPGAVG